MSSYNILGPINSLCKGHPLCPANCSDKSIAVNRKQVNRANSMTPQTVFKMSSIIVWFGICTKWLYRYLKKKKRPHKYTKGFYLHLLLSALEKFPTVERRCQQHTYIHKLLSTSGLPPKKALFPLIQLSIHLLIHPLTQVSLLYLI